MDPAATDNAAQRHRALRELGSGDGGRAAPVNGLGPDAREWFTAHGRRTSFRARDDLAAPFGRPVAMNDPEAGSIFAIRV